MNYYLHHMQSLACTWSHSPTHLHRYYSQTRKFITWSLSAFSLFICRGILRLWPFFLPSLHPFWSKSPHILQQMSVFEEHFCRFCQVSFSRLLMHCQPSSLATGASLAQSEERNGEVSSDRPTSCPGSGESHLSAKRHSHRRLAPILGALWLKKTNTKTFTSVQTQDLLFQVAYKKIR